MNPHPPDPSGTDPEPGADALERRLQAVPFRAVPPEWRRVAIPNPPRAVARPVRRAWWREWRPEGWLGPALAGAWLLVFLLNWDAGRQAAQGHARGPRLTVAQLRAQIDQRRQLMAQLEIPDSPVPAVAPSPARPIPGPRSEWSPETRRPPLGALGPWSGHIA